jgi:hypothetical protein
MSEESNGVLTPAGEGGSVSPNLVTPADIVRSIRQFHERRRRGAPPNKGKMAAPEDQKRTTGDEANKSTPREFDKDYERLVFRLFRDYQPETMFEEAKIVSIAVALWKRGKTKNAMECKSLDEQMIRRSIISQNRTRFAKRLQLPHKHPPAAATAQERQSSRQLPRPSHRNVWRKRSSSGPHPMRELQWRKKDGV